MSEIVKAEVVVFHGQQLIAAIRDGKNFVAAKPICDGMGMAWKPQYVKLTNQVKKYGVTIMVMADARGNEQEMLCIPLNKLDLWLANIHPSKIKNPETREKVEVYQAKCAEALYEYWHNGIAVRTTHNPLDGISKEEMFNRYTDAVVAQKETARENGRLRDDLVAMQPKVPYGTPSKVNGRARTKYIKFYRSEPDGKVPSPPPFGTLFSFINGEWLGYNEKERGKNE